ncbi:MAG TPA: CheR family methyltransferase [Luteibacter sp.]|nr:CheR family methyltransferase [Luteibacter sp.]
MNARADFLVAGVGASAGGIEALEGLFRQVPSDPGVAFVIATHLSPDRQSLLHEVIARYTPLPVQVVEDGVVIEPNTVYVMPSNATMGVREGRLVLHEGTAQRERRPIDIFLSALAVDLGERALGVILSGGDSDGTLGLKAIKEHGGLTFAQVHDGFGPRHPDMPDAAILSGLVDFALAAEELGKKIVDLAQTSTGSGDAPGGLQDAVIEGDISIALPTIYAALIGQIGHDFSGYKTRTFVRRVRRRMQILQLTQVNAYLDRLRDDMQEAGALFRDLLINVTDFFRDGDAFDALAAQVIPRLFEDRDASDTVRIWIPGCATGEEVYSMAILVREHLDSLADAPNVQIFATDIDDRALAVARTGRYPEPLLENVSPARRRRFFTVDGESFVVAREVRDLCVFSPHSVIRDPPFSRIDLVSCRNLLIYFGVEVQNQVIPTFHYALRPGGFLFLGTAENVSHFSDLFAPIDKRHRIFERRPSTSASLPVLPLPHSMRDGNAVSLTPRRHPLSGLALRHAVDQQVLERFAPAHVVVNRDGDVVYFSSRTGKYLETPAGSPTRQLLTMARRELRLDLRTLLRECLESGRPATREGLAIEVDEQRVQFVSITVEPLAERPVSEPLLLVSFTDQGPVVASEGTPFRRPTADDAAIVMERELHETRDRLQSVIEEYETALEELKSSNEELVSVNEELQSTNEELEASKEELQSVNEELHTVNVELSGKVDALDRANNDLNNLFESTNVATVFLDHKLVIRSFTPAVSAIFNIRPTDVGRPITDLTSRLDVERLGDDIAAVFRTTTPTERRITANEGSGHYLVRVAPYQTSDRATRGVVVTFLDVTTMTRSEARQQVLISELQHRTRNLLTLIQSIAQKTLGGVPNVADFSSRLEALSRVQGLIGGPLDDTIDLRDIVRLELTALCMAETRAHFDGPSVRLGFDAVQTVALALHELATNAIKHGAFSNDTGSVDIRWTVEAGQPHDHLVLEWVESGAAIAEAPTHRGFGLELLERALAFTLRARTTLVFRPRGVTCHIDMPLTSQSGIRVVASRETP